MAVRLTIVDEKEPDVEHVRGFVQDRIVLGRAKTCDVCLPNMAISTRHMEIRLENNDYKAVDMGSLNGTWISKKKLVAHRPRILKNEDVISIGDFSIHFRLGMTPGFSTSRDETTAQARQMLASILSITTSKPSRPTLVVLAGPGRAARFHLPLEGERIKIGRARGLEIMLEDKDISREHAEIYHQDGKIIVSDLRSRNGILFNGAQVKTLELSQGVSFILGNTMLGVEHPLDVPLSMIQNAPEEETSSFSPNLPEPPVQPTETAPIEQIQPEPETKPEPTVRPLPIGPPDPMSYPGQKDYVRTTKELTRPKEDKSDLGLIIVGAVIIVAAVAGLAWIFS